MTSMWSLAVDRRWVLTLCAIAGVACRGSRAPDRPERTPLFTEVPVATAPGLSGLAADGAAVWTVAERAAMAYRIALDDASSPTTIEAFAIQGLPADTDLEGIAVLGGGRFAFGTEGHHEGVATVLVGELRGASIAIGSAITLSAADLGIELIENQGVEGVCGAGDTIVASLEGTGEVEGRRWSPVVVIKNGRPAQTHRLWLTTRTGKLSGLDCRIAPDGAISGWAIERHFEVTKILRFQLGTRDVTPVEALDLGPVLRGRLNLEGIAELPDGRVLAVIDNQWRTITGPSELLLFDRAALHGARTADRVGR